MSNSTTDYNKFVLCSYNRAAIDQKHVQTLTESIKQDNKLPTHPILVTKDFEVVNGQHRLLAAKALGVPIYYEVVDTPRAEDIALENMAKGWGPADYFNLYLKHGYEEYGKLNEFMKKTGLPLRFAHAILENNSGSGPSWKKIKSGEYRFNESVSLGHVLLARESISVIKMFSFENLGFLNSVRVWRALISLASFEEFDEERWFANLKKLASRVTMQPTFDAYKKLFSSIYNYHKRSSNKLRS